MRSLYIHVVSKSPPLDFSRDIFDGIKFYYCEYYDTAASVKHIDAEILCISHMSQVSGAQRGGGLSTTTRALLQESRYSWHLVPYNAKVGIGCGVRRSH